MEFEIACTCGQHMLVEVRYIGQEVACPGCQGLLPVPDAPRPGDPVAVVSPVASPPRPPEARPSGPPPPVHPDYAGTQIGRRQTHGRAVAALVCAIVGLLSCPVVFSVAALVLANQAKDAIRMRPDLYDGMGMANAAQTLAVVGLLWCCLVGGCLLSGGF